MNEALPRELVVMALARVNDAYIESARRTCRLWQTTIEGLWAQAGKPLPRAIDASWVWVERGETRMVEWAAPLGLLRATPDNIQRQVVDRLARAECDATIVSLVTHGGYHRSQRVARKAARHGRLQLLAWLVEKGRWPWDAAACLRSAAKGGHSDVVRWLHEEHRAPWSAACAVSAGKSGNLALVRWMLDRGCGWHSAMALSAASAGHLTMVRWLHDHGADVGYAILRAAAANGHINVVDWVVSIGVSCSGREGQLAAIAAHNGHVSVLRWLYRRTEAPMEPWAGRVALLRDRASVVTWWIANRMPLCARGLTLTMDSGRIEWMAYALECGAEWSAWSAFNVVAKNGLPGLRWARRNGCKLARSLMEGLLRHGDFGAALRLHDEGGLSLPKSACSYAIARNNLAALIHLRRRGVPWDVETLKIYLSCASSAVLRWAFRHGAPVPAGACQEALSDGMSSLDALRCLCEFGGQWGEAFVVNAIRADRRDCLQWAVASGCPLPPTALAEAVAVGYVDVARWLRQTCGLAWCGEECSSAALAGHLAMLKWLRRSGCPWDRGECLREAAAHGHDHVVAWIRSLPPTLDDRPDTTAAGCASLLRVL
jgi:hypothetical protein